MDLNRMRVFWHRDTFEDALHDLVVSGYDVVEEHPITEVPSSVLEYGCGTGRMTRALVKDGFTVHAVDVSPSMIEYVKEYVPECSAYLCDGISVPLPSQLVDYAVCYYVLQHQQDVGTMYSIVGDIHRCLKDGGILYSQGLIHGRIADGGFVGHAMTFQDYTDLHDCFFRVTQAHRYGDLVFIKAIK